MSSYGNFKKVFVIIVLYNGQRWIRKCFDSLRKSTYPLHIIAVDNNSTDESAALLEKEYPEVVLLKKKHNLGFGKANNEGLALALKNGGDYFFLLNQDTWINADAIGNLVAAMGTNPQYGVISPLHYNGAESDFDGGFYRCLTKSYTDPDIRRAIEQGSGEVKPVEFINAAAWMVSKMCLEKVGGFGELFYHYGEDRDFVQRLLYHDLSLGYISNARIFHDRDSRERKLNSIKMITWYYRIGFITRVADVNYGYGWQFLSVLGWLTGDIVALLLKGNLWAFPSYFVVLFQVMAAQKKILAYRKKIAGAARFLFLQEEVNP